MNIREQRERDARIAEKAVPEMIDGLRSGRESLEIAQTVSSEHDLDLQKAYRWVQYVEEHFEAARARTARRSALLMWLGIVASLAGAGLFVAGYYGFQTWIGLPILLLVAGLPAAALGTVRGLTARRRVELAAEDLDFT
jgi:VIT1/CCC1 family predicted Fe2+/Mn2+ transporter